MAAVAGIDYDEANVDSLFEKYTINEIVIIEHKTRAEIQKKKEDLRQMVGERYRDLIEAADTIADMKTSIHQVASHISNMEVRCSRLGQICATPAGTSLAARRELIQPLYCLTAQIKLLLDIPEQIWSLIELGQFLDAAQLFLLARHTYASLQLKWPMGPVATAWMPLVTKQWAAIGQLRPSLLKGSRAVLGRCNVTGPELTDSLSALILLGDMNLHGACDVFLDARAMALEELFNLEHHASAVKNQVCDAVQLISSTLLLVGVVFLDENEDVDNSESRGLLVRKLKAMANANSTGHLVVQATHGSPAMKYLPSDITAFHVTLPGPTNPPALETLQSSCSKWLEKVLQSLRDEMKQLLSYLTGIKMLAMVRDMAWNAQLQNGEHWYRICQVLLKHPLQFWDEILQPLFDSQAKKILEDQLGRAFASIHSQVTEATRDSQIFKLELDLSCFIWTEEPGDLTSDVAWVPAAMRTDSNAGGLQLKVQGFTRCTQSICGGLNQQLKAILDDLAFFQPNVINGSLPPMSNDISNFLSSASEASLLGLLEKWHRLIRSMSKTDSNSDDEDSKRYTASVLLMGRLCAGMVEMCPNLQPCIGCAVEIERPALGRKRDQIGEHTPETSRQRRWQSVKAKLQNGAELMFRLWKSVLVSQFEEQLADMTKILTPAETVYCMAQWDVVEIEEENEEGDVVKSTIRIPGQISWSLLEALHGICVKASRAGGHALPRIVFKELQWDCLNIVLTTFEAMLLPDPPNQALAIQRLFDLQFVHGLLDSEDNRANSEKLQHRMKETVDRLESQIDPFDLHVFAPYIRDRIRHCIRRSAVMLGMLATASSLNLAATRATNSSSLQEQPSVLVTSMPVSRFPLLPIGSLIDATGNKTVNPPSSNPNPTLQTYGPEMPTISPPMTSIPRVDSNSLLHRWFRSSS